MRKFLLFLFFTGIFQVINAQSATSTVSTSFAFSCSKDTILSCGGANCITLKALIPDLFTGTDSYNSVLTSGSSCYQPYVALTTPGEPDFNTLTTDDVYSQPINIGFAFPFYGSNYTQLVASTNGYVSFDITKAGLASHYDVSADLPTTTYDRALIMGVYHDLDPSSRSNPPSTMLIKYNVLGNAPYRRWIFSFNDVPLYSTNASTCGVLNQNRHQIVLYESTGIIEVWVESKQVCTAWQNGKAIIGIQNYARNAGVMAPGRAFSSGVWGFVNMNETWRFVPSGGTSTFKGVELYDLSGNLVSTGTTISDGSGNLKTSFPNVCPALTGTTSYVVKSTYSKIDDPNVNIFGTDTIRVVRQPSLPVTATATATNCGGSTGTVTATVTGNAGTQPYQFSIDGGALQSASFFTGLTGGSHSLFATDFNGCQNTITVLVPTNNALNGTAVGTSTSCTGVNNGTITVTPGSGVAPFTYSLDGGPLQSSNVFTGLAPGLYSVAFYDAGGCSGSYSPVQVQAGGGLTATAVFTNTGCATVNNGTATVTPTNGTAPYTFSINGGPTQATGVFTGLAPNSYSIVVRDANGCNATYTGTVDAGASLTATYSSINPPCSGINNGSITVTPTTGTAPYTYSLNGGSSQASPTFNSLAANTYLISFSDALGCAGSISVTLTPATPLITTTAIQDANCFADNNGSITLSPSGGTTPYQYSINGGTTYQPSATFNGLIAGSYSVRIKDVNGCNIDQPFTIAQPTLLTASSTTVDATCNGNDGIIRITANGGTIPYLYSVDNGADYQAADTFKVVPAAYNNILIKDAHGCIATTSATVILTDTMRLAFGADVTTCQGTAATLTPLTNSATTGFAWTPSTGLNSSTVQNPLANPADTTVYTLVAKWGSCQRTASTQVNVLYKPVAHAGLDTAICNLTFAYLKGSATHTSGAVSYLWTPSSKANPPSAASSVARPDSTQIFTLEVSDNYGCNFKVYDDVLITMQPPVPAYAGNDTNAVYGIAHQLYSSGGVSYLWTPAGPLDNAFAQNPKATLTSDTRFRVFVTDVAGCVGSDDVLIKVYKGPTYYVPNAFSPNGDGRNELFRPTPVGIVSTEYFRVFNRYGQLVFQTTKWLDGWDGTFQGKKQPQGAYTWMIKGTDRDGKNVEMKGVVLLVQ